MWHWHTKSPSHWSNWTEISQAKQQGEIFSGGEYLFSFSCDFTNYFFHLYLHIILVSCWSHGNNQSWILNLPIFPPIILFIFFVVNFFDWDQNRKKCKYNCLFYRKTKTICSKKQQQNWYLQIQDLTNEQI